MKKTILFLLAMVFMGCGSNQSIIAWKPTTTIINASPESEGAITATTSPTQPTELSGNTASGLPGN